MSWLFGGGKAATAAAAAVSISVQELLSRTEYMGDFQEAQRVAQEQAASSPLLKQLERCADIQRHLTQCLEKSESSDPKCLLLHQAWMICAAREVAPALHTTFVQCAERHRGKPELCENDFQSMWNGVLSVVRREESVVQRSAMSDAEEEVLLDCKALKEQTDRILAEKGGDSPAMDDALERWMQCVFPQTCAEGWARYQRCMSSKGASADTCIEEGRPLMHCITDFTIRYHRRGQ